MGVDYLDMLRKNAKKGRSKALSDMMEIDLLSRKLEKQTISILADLLCDFQRAIGKYVCIRLANREYVVFHELSAIAKIIDDRDVIEQIMEENCLQVVCGIITNEFADAGILEIRLDIK